MFFINKYFKNYRKQSNLFIYLAKFNNFTSNLAALFSVATPNFVTPNYWLELPPSFTYSWCICLLNV